MAARPLVGRAVFLCARANRRFDGKGRGDARLHGIALALGRPRAGVLNGRCRLRPCATPKPGSLPILVNPRLAAPGRAWFLFVAAHDRRANTRFKTAFASRRHSSNSPSSRSCPHAGLDTSSHRARSAARLEQLISSAALRWRCSAWLCREVVALICCRFTCGAHRGNANNCLSAMNERLKWRTTVLIIRFDRYHPHKNHSPFR